MKFMFIQYPIFLLSLTKKKFVIKINPIDIQFRNNTVTAKKLLFNNK